jgi:hypothetical protein
VSTRRTRCGTENLSSTSMHASRDRLAIPPNWLASPQVPYYPPRNPCQFPGRRGVGVPGNPGGRHGICGTVPCDAAMMRVGLRLPVALWQSGSRRTARAGLAVAGSEDQAPNEANRAERSRWQAG